VDGFGERGRVDLSKGLRRPVDRFDYGVNSPPLVIGDVVVVGSFVSDGWLMREGAPGDVRAFDARSGRLLWTFHTVPQAAELGSETWLEESWRAAGSTNVWSWMSADEQLGYVFLPVSTPTNDHYGGDRLGDNLFAESVVCLEARTGRRIWHFQVAHHGLWDYDLPAPPVLADLTVDGRKVPALAQVTKQAFVFVLDRRTGAPLWPIEERPVPSSRVPGERAAPTQPFPTRPAPFDRQGLGKDDLLDFTPTLRAEAEALVSNFDHGPLYTPPSEAGTIQLPGTVGGASWAGAALDPETATLFVPSVTIPNTVTIAPPENSASDMRYVTRPGRPKTEGPRGLPLVKPPYGRITAIDLNTGEHRWMVPHGTGPRDHPALEGLKLAPLGWDSRGFVVATKSLLLAVQEPRVTVRLAERGAAFEFTAETREARLRAFDKATGGLVGETELPANAGGAPITYRVGSRQFIVIPIGGGGVPPELVALAVEPSSADGR
jgi:glucose dehydrogenase